MIIKNFLLKSRAILIASNRLKISKNKLIPQYKSPNPVFSQNGIALNKQINGFATCMLRIQLLRRKSCQNHLMLRIFCQRLLRRLCRMAQPQNMLLHQNLLGRILKKKYNKISNVNIFCAGTNNLTSPLINKNNYYTQKLNLGQSPIMMPTYLGNLGQSPSMLRILGLCPRLCAEWHNPTTRSIIEFKEFFKNYKYEKLLNNYKEFNNLPDGFTSSTCPSASASAVQDCSSMESPSNQKFYKNYVYGFKNLTKEKQQKLKLETGFSKQSIFCTLAQEKLLKKSSFRTSRACTSHASPAEFALQTLETKAAKTAKGPCARIRRCSRCCFAASVCGAWPSSTKTKVLDPGAKPQYDAYLFKHNPKHNGVNELLAMKIAPDVASQEEFSGIVKNTRKFSGWAIQPNLRSNQTLFVLGLCHSAQPAKQPKQNHAQQHQYAEHSDFQSKNPVLYWALYYKTLSNNLIHPTHLRAFLKKPYNTQQKDTHERLFKSSGAIPQYRKHLLITNLYISPKPTYCFLQIILEKYLDSAKLNLMRQHQETPSPLKLPNKIEPYGAPDCFSKQQNNDWSTSDSAFQILAKQQEKINLNIKVDQKRCYAWQAPTFAQYAKHTEYAKHPEQKLGPDTYSLKLFKKISNKTILTYWLVPVAGFAFISGNITMLSRSFNNYEMSESPAYTAVDSSMKLRATSSPIIILSNGCRAYSFCAKDAKTNGFNSKQNGAKAKTHLNTINRVGFKNGIASNKCPNGFVIQQNPSKVSYYFPAWMHSLQNVQRTFKNNNWYVSPLYSNQIVKNNLNFIKRQNKIFYASHGNFWDKRCKQSLKLLKSKLIKLDKADNSKKTWLALQTLEVLSDNQLYTPFTSYNQGLNNVSQFLKNPACSIAAFKSRFKISEGQAIEINKSQKPYYILISKLTNLTPNFIINLDNLLTVYYAEHNIQNTTQDASHKVMQSMTVGPSDPTTKAAKTKHLHYIDNKTKLLSNYFENYCQLSKEIKHRSQLLWLGHSAQPAQHPPTTFVPKVVGYAEHLSKSCDLQQHQEKNILLTRFEPDSAFALKPLKLKLNLMQVRPDAAMQNGFERSFGHFGCSALCEASKWQNAAHKSIEPKKVKIVKKGSSYFIKELVLKKQAKSRANPFLNSLSMLLSQDSAKLNLMLQHQEKMFKNNSESINPHMCSHQKMLAIFAAKKLSIQKKRKAKKQRLETRRQKKRIRFYPRPVWLRYRLFLNLINQRLIRYDNAIASIKQDTKLVKLPLINYNKSNKFRYSYSAQQSRKNYKTQFKKLVYLFNFKPESTFQFVKHQRHTRFIKLNKQNQSTQNKVDQNMPLRSSCFKNPFERFDYNHMQSIIKKNLKTKKFNISNQKIKANYSNFNNEKKNNSPPTNNLKTNNQNTVFRDFWISAYNNSLTKSYIPLKWFLPTKPSNQMFIKSIKNAYNKSRNALRINWALKKTNTNSITSNNTRYLLWGTQKLRNQSKNNKTKFFEKQFIRNWDYFFLKKNLSNFYKKINNKLIRKNQKLIYITNTNFKRSKTPKTQSIVFKRKDIKFFNPKQISIANWQNQRNLPSLKHFLTRKKNISALHNIEQQYLILGSCIFLHLCALISLVTISQVRCFSKFHIILLYKLSNFYNSLIQKISNLIKIKKVRLSSEKLPLKPFEHASHLNSVQQNLEAKYSKNDYNATQIASFSLNLLKKEDKKIIKSNIISNVVILNLKNRNSMKFSTKSKLTAKPTPGSASYKQLLRSSMSAKQDNSKLQQHKMLLTKVNIVSSKSLFLKYIFSLGWPLMLSLKTSKQKQLSKLNDNNLVKKQNRVYHINQKIFYFNKNKIFLVKFFKEKTSFISFNIINMFQKSVRTVSNFFEKPAEFTTTWIAFGFLIEWSSDLINVIPENIDIFVWDSFYKLTRVIPIQFFLYFNSGTISLLLNKTGLNITTMFDLKSQAILIASNPLNKLAQNSLLLKTTNLVISHLFYRRILHLIDVFIETISQPDTDLISRQEKGTLFWDIWADFLVTAADYYNVNIAALSTIKAEQNLLIKKISNNFDIDFQLPAFVEPMYASHTHSALQNQKGRKSGKVNMLFLKKQVQYQQNIILDKIINSCLVGPGSTLQKLSAMHSVNSVKGNQSKGFLVSSNDRWSINQFLTYQSCKNLNTSNGDLFIDFHAPKAFAHIPTIKYNKILQQPIGTLVCQIYSGIFSKQVSKNLLLVNMANSLEPSSDYNIQLIQALAGETELKIIRDNAHRYALVNRGFAIGIKLLKDVFFAIALNTPCIFLLEDLHAIGERRPMLLSDYGSSPGSNLSNAERDEVHEKNQVVYQLTRHSIAHYKKPFKGDYSLAIPTNLYSLDLFLKQPSQSTSNLSLIVNHNLTLKNKIKIKSQNNKKASVQTQHHSLTKNVKTKKANSTYLTPPSTSPFSVLLLKEEKKLKQNKIVEEIAWTGVSVSSLGLQDFQRDSGKHDETKPRTSYSVRAKVSMLAELSLSNISAKLDMITDLLVIIDSVRSNKGFVVFATTNMPHVLDPALRRPGRFDETICLPNINTSSISYFIRNYELIKSVKSGLSCFAYPTTFGTKVGGGSSATHAVLSKALPVQPFFLNRNFNLNSLGAVNLPLVNQKQFLSLTVNYKDYNTILRIKTHHNQSADPLTLNNALISYSKKIKEKTKKPHFASQNLDAISIAMLPFAEGQNKAKAAKTSEERAKHQEIDKQNNLKLLYCKATAYHEVGKIMLQYYLTSFFTKHFSDQTQLNLKSINYLSLYGLKNKFLLQLMLIFGGKVALLLSQKSKLISNNLILNTNKKNSRDQVFSLVNKPFNLYTKKILDSEIFENNDNLKLATSLMLFFIHKRYLYLKNLIVPQLLSFTEGTLFEEPAGPPFSNLLIPAKRFENYKRLFRDSFIGDNMGQRTSQIPLIEKQQYHTQVNKIKLLNNKQDASNTNLVKTTQNLIENGYNNMSNYVQTPTTINWYYQNLLLKRHGQYLTNQWFNGQLSEHNTETVFLSDIDWRSSFIKQKQSNVPQLKNVYTLLKQKKGYSDRNMLRKSNSISKFQDLNQSGLDILLDFPDTDQYYNPRRRRWLLNKGYWSFWFNLDKVYSEEIIKTWLLESIIQTYTYLYNNTELLDFITSKFIILGYPNYTHFNLNQKLNLTLNSAKTELSTVKEIIVTNSFKRF